MVLWTVVTDPRTVQEVDALGVAVKAYDTASALAGLRHLRVQSVFSVQNGLLKHEQLASAFGAQKTIGAACRFAGEVLASGTVRYRLERERSLGPLRGQEVTPAQTLRHTLRHAGLQAVYSECIQTLKWSKCVGWLGFTTLGGLNPSGDLHISQQSAYGADQRPGDASSRATRRPGGPLEDRPPLPSASVVAASDDQAVVVLQGIGASLREHAPQRRQSALQEVERGRRLEVEETLG
jgi:ketopantoate reductase